MQGDPVFEPRDAWTAPDFAPIRHAPGVGRRRTGFLYQSQFHAKRLSALAPARTMDRKFQFWRPNWHELSRLPGNGLPMTGKRNAF